MKCYKKVFIKNNLKYNLGFFILFGVIVFFVISCFIFICKSFSQLCIDIKKIILAKRNIQFNNNLTKLNLSICRDTKIEISIPVIINENLDKYNINSEYYNDICTKATSKYSSDIILSDRKNEFINNNMTLCEENCQLIDYNYTNKKVKCSCDVKMNLHNIDEIKFDKELLK